MGPVITGSFEKRAPVYKWVPANLMLEVGVVASCYRNQDKLRPDEPLGSNVDFTFTYHELHLFRSIQFLSLALAICRCCFKFKNYFRSRWLYFQL